MSYYIPHKTSDVITYLCPNLRWSMFVKEAPGETVVRVNRIQETKWSKVSEDESWCSMYFCNKFDYYHMPQTTWFGTVCSPQGCLKGRQYDYLSACQATPKNIPKCMGLLSDTYNCGLRMRRECRERLPRHPGKRKPLVSDPSMHHGTCVTHVPLCMSGSLTAVAGKTSPDNIPNCMKEVTWLMLCLSTNGHRTAGLGWLPFI